jgi:hypothetical protein
LERFLERNTICTVDEGYFSVITDDILNIIVSFVEDNQSYAMLSQVNKRMQRMAQTGWKTYNITTGILDDEVFWRNNAAKDWKWVVRMKTVSLFLPNIIEVSVQLLGIKTHLLGLASQNTILSIQENILVANDMV